MNTIGIGGSVLASSCCRSRPLNPGSRTSRTRQLGASGRLVLKNSWGVLNAFALRPTVPSSLVRASHIDGSSSTMYTIESSPLMALPFPRGHDELKCCPVAGVRRRPQPPSMGQNNRLAYRQPHAQSVGLRRVQGLEETLDVSLLEPNSCVVHDDPHTGACADLVSMRADHQLPTPVGDVAHRLDRVGQQIQHDLLKLNPIAENRWQIT